MRQQELSVLVRELKAEVEKSPCLNRKSVADRAIMTNTAALDLLLETADPERGAASPATGARLLKGLSHEFVDVSRALRALSAR